MRKQYLYIIILLYIINCKVCFSQNNSVYLELLGNTGYGAIGYERKLLKAKNIRWHTVIGAGTYKLRDFNHKLNPDIAVPVLQKVSFSLHSRHSLFIASGLMWNSYIDADREFKARRHHEIRWNNNTGYSFDLNKRWQFQLYYVLIAYRSIQHWVGLKINFKW